MWGETPCCSPLGKWTDDVFGLGLKARVNHRGRIGNRMSIQYFIERVSKECAAMDN